MVLKLKSAPDKANTPSQKRQSSSINVSLTYFSWLGRALERLPACRIRFRVRETQFEMMLAASASISAALLPILVLLGENGRIASRKILSPSGNCAEAIFGGIRRPAESGRARLMGLYDMDEECPCAPNAPTLVH
jgi:hypothetical protein